MNTGFTTKVNKKSPSTIEEDFLFILELYIKTSYTTVTVDVEMSEILPEWPVF